MCGRSVAISARAQMLLKDTVADDVDWSAEAADSSIVSWYGPRSGKDQVGAFFAAYGSAMDVQEFTPVTYAANDTEVLSVVHIRGTARATGKTIDMNVHHHFKFADDKIVYWRGTEDTAQSAAALQG